MAGVGFWPLLCKKTKKDWTEKHRNDARKLVLEGGWVQKKLLDIGWSDESECQSLSQRGRHREAQALPLPRMERGQTGDSRGVQKVEAKSQNFKKRSGSGKEVLSRVHSVKANGTVVNSSMKKREPEKHKKLEHYSRRFQGPRCHLTALFWVLLEKWGACGWSVVQSDYDEELGPLHGMYGSMEAEFEVQRTIKRAELTAFLCLLKKVIGPIKVHVDNKGIIDGLR